MKTVAAKNDSALLFLVLAAVSILLLHCGGKRSNAQLTQPLTVPSQEDQSTRNELDKNMATLVAECVCFYFGLLKPDTVQGMSDLLKDGADEKILVEKCELEPLHIAVVRGDMAVLTKMATPEAIEQLVYTKPGLTKPLILPSLIHLAVAGGRLDVVDMLVKRGANVDEQRADYRMTPLMLAARLGNLEMTRLLLALGADISLTDKNERTALDYASSNNRSAVAKALIDAGAKVNATD